MKTQVTEREKEINSKLNKKRANIINEIGEVDKDEIADI